MKSLHNYYNTEHPVAVDRRDRTFLAKQKVQARVEGRNMNSMIQRDAELDDANLRLGFFDVYHRNSFKEPARTIFDPA
jgi:hypothetical protein